MSEHDEAACARRMSRRYFFGLMVGGVAVAANGGLPAVEIVSPISVQAPPLLTSDVILAAAMERYEAHVVMARLIDKRFKEEFFDKPVVIEGRMNLRQNRFDIPFRRGAPIAYSARVQC